MKKYKFIIFTLVITLALLVVGCKKNDLTGENNQNRAEVSFDMTASPISVGDDKTKALVLEPLPLATEVRVIVYNQNTTTSPIASGEYVIRTTAGVAVPKTAADKILLSRGTYDFYYFAPNIAPTANEVSINSGLLALASGKTTEVVELDIDGKCIMNVDLKRLNALINVIVYYESNKEINSVSLTGDITISGLAPTAKMNILTAAMTVEPTFTASATISKDKFIAVANPEGAGTTGLSTFTNGTHRGAIVLPALIGDGIVEIPMSVNGSAKNAIVKLAEMNLEAGKYYTLKLKVKLSSEIEASVEEFIHKQVSDIMGVDPGSGLGTGWAGSNIYWDGTKLTFDDSGVTTNENNIGVHFQWGSLVAISPMDEVWDNSKILFWTGDKNQTGAAWSAAATTKWANIPRLKTVPFTNTDKNLQALIVNHDPERNIGDICKYMSDNGLAPASPQGWRIPTYQEFLNIGASQDQKYEGTSVLTTSDIGGTTKVAGFRTAKAGSDGVFFPYSGRRASSSGSTTELGMKGYTWSATPSSNGRDTHCLYYSFQSVSGFNQEPSNSFGVRCIRIK